MWIILTFIHCCLWLHCSIQLDVWIHNVYTPLQVFLMAMGFIVFPVTICLCLLYFVEYLYMYLSGQWNCLNNYWLRWLLSYDLLPIQWQYYSGIILGTGSVQYIDVIMTTMASQITSLKVVYSTVYSDADQRKHQSSASLAFVRGIHRDRWIPRTKGQLRGKCFHLMTSSWNGSEWASDSILRSFWGQRTARSI